MSPPITQKVLDLAAEIQQIASPTFGEEQRGEFIRKYFCTMGIKEVEKDDLGNVYAHLRGKGDKSPIVVSAHLDTVFPQGTDLTIKRSEEKISGPGIGDNSLGLAGLFGLYWMIQDSKANHKLSEWSTSDIWLVANVCEEGLGDLRGMKGVVKRFGRNARAYIVLEGMSLGQIYHRGLGVRRYGISVHTKGGHSWIDYGKPSAIHELTDLAVKIKNIPLPREVRSSINIGVIEGGTSVNTIAADARLELDLRSVDKQRLEILTRQVENLVEEANQNGGEAVEIRAEVIGNRPVGEIPAEHPLVNSAVECITKNGVKPILNIGSTDANEPLSRGLPAICIGLTTGGRSHTVGEYIDTKPVSQGLAILTDLVKSICKG